MKVGTDPLLPTWSLQFLDPWLEQAGPCVVSQGDREGCGPQPMSDFFLGFPTPHCGPDLPAGLNFL